METKKTVEYWRNPTPYEIKFGDGAIHWLTIELKYVTKKRRHVKKVDVKPV